MINIFDEYLLSVLDVKKTKLQILNIQFEIKFYLRLRKIII